MTRAELKTWIVSMGFGIDTATQQNDMLLRALQELAGRRRWKWMELQTLDGLTLTVGNHSLVSGTRIAWVKQLLIKDPANPNSNDPLLEIDLPTFFEYDATDRTNGVPRYFVTSGDGNTIYVYPRPDKAYTVSMDAAIYPDTTVFDADGESPPFDARFHLVLGWRVVQWLSYRYKDWTAYASASNEYDKLVREMEQADGTDEVSGHIKRSDYYDRVK